MTEITRFAERGRFAKAIRQLQEPPAVLSGQDCKALLVGIERWRYLLEEASLLVWSSNREFSAQIDVALKEAG